VGSELEGQGGKYLEDCQVSKAKRPDQEVFDPGYATWAYDTQAAKRLWEESLTMVNFQE